MIDTFTDGDDLFSKINTLSLEEKVQNTLKLIDSFYTTNNGKIYLSYSGGKDSDVLLHLCNRVHSDIKPIFCNTGVEYPEITRHAKACKGIKIIKPTKKFKQILEEYGYPVISKEISNRVYEYRLRGVEYFDSHPNRYKLPKRYNYLIDAPFKISDKCCYHLKKSPFKKYERVSKESPIMGLMATDSSMRRISILKSGSNQYNRERPMSFPLAIWTQTDIIQYIYENKIKIADCYGKIEKEGDRYHLTGVKHTGCFFCMFGLSKEHPNKFQIMKRTHPKMYSYCMNELGMKRILEYVNIPH